MNLAGLMATAQYSPRKAECFDRGSATDWFCHLNHGKVRAFVTGDSHALALLPAFERVAQDGGFDILFAGFSGCPPLQDIYSLRGDQQEQNCHTMNKRVLAYVVANGIKDVFLVGRWSYYTDGRYDGTLINLLATELGKPEGKEISRAAFVFGVDRTVEEFAKAGVTLHIVKDVPSQLQDMGDLARKMARQPLRTTEVIEEISVTRSQHHKLQRFANDKFSALAVDVIDLDPIYCKGEICPFATPGSLLYIDNDHLSVTGALLAVPILSTKF